MKGKVEKEDKERKKASITLQSFGGQVTLFSHRTHLNNFPRLQFPIFQRKTSNIAQSVRRSFSKNKIDKRLGSFHNCFSTWTKYDLNYK